MDILEREFAQRVASGFPLYRVAHKAHTFDLNFRCVICGDSKKDPYMARGHVYEYKGRLRYGCFNCGWNDSFITFMKLYYPTEYNNYIFEKYKDKKEHQKLKTDVNELDAFKNVEKMPIPKPRQSLPYCENIGELDENHPVTKYLLERQVPKSKLYLFEFTNDWKKLANEVGYEETYSEKSLFYEQPRLVIPIKNEDGEIVSLQGRALRANDSPRYLTIKCFEDASKLFGVERVHEGIVYFFEGAIDSIFIPNSVAMTGGKMSVYDAPYADRRVWVLDNEPRKPETMNHYKNLVNSGEKIVLWDKAKWKSKDINDMILKDGATPEEIYDYIKNNSLSGHIAKLRLSNWCKV